jgi:hypothetical protein
MGDGENKTEAQKTGSAAGMNALQRWVGTTTQIFTLGWTYAIPLVAFLWTVVILIYALQLPGGVRWDAFATAVLTGSCSFLAGGLVGFLFGIPRSAVTSGQAAPAGQYQANSNLVEVSDWLTKIIVGVGLVQIGRVVPALTRLAVNLKAPLGGQPSSAAFGIVLVIGNVLLGFLFFYLWARSLAERNFELSDGTEQNGTALAVDKTADGSGQTVVAPAPGKSLAPAQPAAAIKPSGPSGSEVG